jgi:hypothetical protein
VAIPDVAIDEFYIKSGGSHPNFFNQAKILTTVVNHSYYNLLLAYTVEVKMVKRDDHGIIRESFTRDGTIMLPARQTNPKAVLVSDLRQGLPHLEIDDMLFYPNGELVAEDLMPGRAVFYGSLTLSMPANIKCGPGRPLEYQKKTLFFW